MLDYKQVLGQSVKVGLVVGSILVLTACSSSSNSADKDKGGNRNNGNGYSEQHGYPGDQALEPSGRQLAVYKSAGFSIDPQLPQYEPKMLNENARGIAVAYNMPYNCKVLGEVEGKDSANGKAGPTFEQIREGATNDLRNQAADLVRGGHRLMLSVTKEAMVCQIREGKSNEYREEDCTLWSEIPDGGQILSYRIHANVFECGEK